MKILHTADIHLDRAFAAPGLPPERGNQNRLHLHSILQAILDRAAATGAGAIVITGDLFEHERVTQNTVDTLCDAFAALNPLPVLICPGRHDPYVASSPYRTAPWSQNVHIFAARKWQAIPLPSGPVTIHGFAWDGSDDGGGPVPQLPEIPDDNRVHLAFGYGMEAQIRPGERTDSSRFDPPLELPPRLAYLGLGGVHTACAIEDDAGRPIWYPGTPEGRGFDEPGPHAYLELAIDPSHGVSVAPVTASEGRFHQATIDCSDFDSGSDLLDAARRILDARPAVPYMRLTLEGTIPRQIYAEFDDIRDALAGETPCIQWRDTCQLAENFDAIAQEQTSLGAFLDRMNIEIDDAPTRALRLQRCRSRDLGLCACRGPALPVRGISGDYR